MHQCVESARRLFKYFHENEEHILFLSQFPRLMMHKKIGRIAIERAADTTNTNQQPDCPSSQMGGRMVIAIGARTSPDARILMGDFPSGPILGGPHANRQALACQSPKSVINLDETRTCVRHWVQRT